MLKSFDALSIDWIDCLVDRNENLSGCIVWREDFDPELKPGYAVAVPLPYDTENPKIVDTSYWLLRIWHDPEFFDLDIDWQRCAPSFIVWCDRVYRQWFDVGFCDAVPIW